MQVSAAEQNRKGADLFGSFMGMNDHGLDTPLHDALRHFLTNAITVTPTVAASAVGAKAVIRSPGTVPAGGELRRKCAFPFHR